MKNEKLIESVQNVRTFEEAWQLFEVLHETKGCAVELIRKKNAWLCRLVRETSKVDGKDVKYIRSFILENESDTLLNAFKITALSYLQK